MPDLPTFVPRRRWLALPGIVAIIIAPLAGPFAPLAVLAGVVACTLAMARGQPKASLAALARLWLAAFVLGGVLLGWPLARLAAAGNLGAAFATATAAGLLLLAAWRSWPLWSRAFAGELDSLRDWRRVIEIDPAAWRGLKSALPATALVGGGIALGWPELMPMPLRWGLAALLAAWALWPVLRMKRESAPARVARAEAEAKTGKKKEKKKADKKSEPAGERRLRNADRIELDALFAEHAAASMQDKGETKSDVDTEAISISSIDAGTASASQSAAGDLAPAAPASHSPEAVAAATAALYAAARAGRVERALALLDEGADPLSPPPVDERDQRGLAQLAVVLPDLRLLRELIQRGLPLGAEPGRLTALLAATRDSWHGRPEAVMTLLANGADPRARDAEGNSPLHHAARSTDPGVAALLLDAASEIDALNDARQSPLAMACLVGNWRLAKFLSERGAQAHPAGGDPVLLAAAGTEEDDPVGVQYLLRHRAAVNAVGADGRTALHQAASAGHVGIVQTLLDAGADVHKRDEAGLDAWLLAAPAGQLGVMEALLDAGANPDAVDGEGRDALMRALDEGQASAALARWLRERGMDTQRLDVHGERALDRAVASGRWSLVAAIDPNYPLPTANLSADDEVDIARPPMQLLSEALVAGDEASVARLAQLLSAEELGRALVEAASSDPSRIPMLLRHHPTLDVRGPQGDTALFVLMDSAGLPEARKAMVLLLEATASPAGRAGLARYLAACMAMRVTQADGASLALDLLSRGADGFASHEGEPPLLLALRLGWPRLASHLLDLGADPNQADARGLTPLHVATALGVPGMVPALLRHGAQPAVRAGDGQTALGVALASGKRDLAAWLDWRGWPHPGRRLQARDLASAAIMGDADAVQHLLDLGFDVDTRDAQGCTALLRAAGGGHEAVIARLLAAGADTGLATESGATPLSAAVSMRHLGVLDRLLSAGVDLDQRMPGGVTVLMLAAALGLPDVVSRLLAAGADIDAGDVEGLKPMHCAALFGFSTRDRSRLLALVDTLQLAGAPIDEATPTGLTPLLLLLGARAEPGSPCDEEVVIDGMERLLEEGASLSVQEQRGFGVLHLAALHGLGRVVRALLQAGADPHLRDRLNRTPRDIAAMRGYMDVAAEFATDAAPLSMARFLRDSER
ncbi:MAG: ankyrin repeat domain-containing protein [Xanthomonadaceae bacterium]|nr:ankyrin repeat domain-containing protein [Xanthomonadaceae bacterium]